MYDGIKKAIGPSAVKTAPLKSNTGELLTNLNNLSDGLNTTQSPIQQKTK